VRTGILQTLGVVLVSAAALVAAPIQRWIHVRVESATGANGMTINVPIQMAEAILPAIPAGQHQGGKFSFDATVNGADLRAVLDAVRNSPDTTSVDMERHGKIVSVAKSQNNLLIKIADKPGAEPRTGETVTIKVPIPVVKALVADNSDQLNVASGIRVLAQQGEVDVTVNKPKETVHVWTDTRTTTD
jgi:hypothetical protein